jgi:hypothetical protein
MKPVDLAQYSALAIALALPIQAHAFHPLITDDTGTQGVSTQGTGNNQLEVGYDVSRSQLAGATDTARSLGLTYTRGITENLDLFIGVPRQVNSPSGWGNVDIGAKWRFFEDEASKFGLALKPEVLLPVSRSAEAKGLGNGKVSYGVTLIASKETSFGEVHFNAELARSNFDDSAIDDRKTFWRLSVAPVWAVAEGWKVALDLGLQTNPDRSQDATMAYAEAGVVYSPNDAFDLSFGLIRDLKDGPVETTTATAQVTWHF